jgi:hypothetical protein
MECIAEADCARQDGLLYLRACVPACCVVLCCVVLCCVVLCWYVCCGAAVGVESGGYGCIFRAANGARVDEWLWLLDRRRRSRGARVAVCCNPSMSSQSAINERARRSTTAALQLHHLHHWTRRAGYLGT